MYKSMKTLAHIHRPACADEIERVRHYITRDDAGREGCVTGLIVDEDEATITVRMYSAGCLHMRDVIRRDQLVDERPL